MRGVVWLVLLFTVAVVAAALLGRNDGLVTLAWQGWRVEASLNLVLALLVLAGLTGLLVARALDALLSLPKRASEWRALQRERAAHGALREALVEYFGARYSRAQKAARRAMAIHDDSADLPLPADHRLLAALVAAGSLHRLQDRGGRDAMLQLIDSQAGTSTARAVLDGSHLLAAEWALDDQNAERALEHLASLPPGVARRTQALRLKLRAARARRLTQEALATSRLLAKHGAFSEAASVGLLRALAIEHLEAARDSEQLRRQWQALDDTDRQDAVVLVHAVRRAVRFADAALARQWLARAWPRLPQLTDDEREVLFQALAGASEGAESDWVERVEAAAQQWPADAAVSAAAGQIFADRQLWGKARAALERACRHEHLEGRTRRRAWRTLAQMARQDGAEEVAARCEREAAQIDD